MLHNGGANDGTGNPIFSLWSRRYPRKIADICARIAGGSFLLFSACVADSSDLPEVSGKGLSSNNVDWANNYHLDSPATPDCLLWAQLIYNHTNGVACLDCIKSKI